MLCSADQTVFPLFTMLNFGFEQKDFNFPLLGEKLQIT